jgi:hypothetical protein
MDGRPAYICGIGTPQNENEVAEEFPRWVADW